MGLCWYLSCFTVFISDLEQKVSASSSGLWMSPNGWCSWHTRGQGSHPQGIQQGHRQSPTPWVDQPPAGHRLGTAWQGSSSAGKALGVTVGSKLDVRLQCVLAAAAQLHPWWDEQRQSTGWGKRLSPSTWHPLDPHLILSYRFGSPLWKRHQ